MIEKIKFWGFLVAISPIVLLSAIVLYVIAFIDWIKGNRI